MTDKELEIFYDHYNDTFKHQLIYIEKRDRYFVLLFSLVSVMFLILSLPDFISYIATLYAETHIKKEVKLELRLLTSTVLFFICFIMIKYYQINIHIERRYTYIHEAEELLSSISNGLIISREGKSYLNDYPYLSNVISLLYKYVFPLLIVALTWYSFSINTNSYFWFDLLATILVTILTILYLPFIRKKDKNKSS